MPDTHSSPASPTAARLEETVAELQAEVARLHGELEGFRQQFE